MAKKKKHGQHRIWARSIDFPAETARLASSILTLEYSEEEKSAAKLRLVLDNRDGELLASQAIARGAVLEVAFGYEGLRSRPLRCVVRRVSGPLREITVEAHSAGVLMDSAQRGRTFKGKRRSDVVREIARENGFPDNAVYIEETEDVFESISQAGATDAAFLQKLAKKEGKQFWVDETGLYFQERDLGQESTLVLVYGGQDSVFNQDPTVELDNVVRAGRVRTAARDPIRKQTIETVTDNRGDPGRLGLGRVTEVVDPETRDTEFRIGSERVPAAVALQADRVLRGLEAEVTQATAAPGGGRGGTASRVSRDSTEQVATSREGANRAASRGRYREGARTAVKLGIDVVGDPRIMSRRILTIQGLPAGLSGQYWVARATHRIDTAGGYSTTADLRSDGRGEQPASGCADGTARPDVERALQELVAAASGSSTGPALARRALQSYRKRGAAAADEVRDAAIAMTGAQQPQAVRDAAMKVIGLVGNAGSCDPDKSEAVIKTTSPPIEPGSRPELVETVNPETRGTSLEIRFRD
jgi:phage protein D